MANTQAIHDYRTWIEISKSALNHNFAQYKSIIGSGILAPVIKSNAYGHGLIEVGTLCEESPHVGFLFTAMLSEALILRAHGVSKPILVHNYIDTNLDQAAHQNIDFVIDSFDTAQQLNTVGAQHNAIFNVHIKVDTGLSRLGITPEQVLTFIHDIKQLPHIKLTGICTHFAESSKKEQQFTHHQLEVFNTVLNTLEQHHITIPYKHVANSAATTSLKLNRCNFFRVGIGTYGLWPSQANKKKTLSNYPNFSLQPILTWKTRIIALKKVPAQRYVGYDRTYQTSKDTIIATLPIGYYDGYDFRLFNKATMRVNNYYAPVIGRVSMNLTTIDVTDIPNIQLGTEVIILGDYPHINAHELSMLAENPNVREITTKINTAIPRIIVP